MDTAPKELSSMDVVRRIADTLPERAHPETEKLIEKLSYTAPERIMYVCWKGAGMYGGITHLCNTYGTDQTRAVFNDIKGEMDRRVQMGLSPLCDAI